MSRFTQGELEVMRILWEHGELKPAEIHAHFPRKINNPSLRSYLAILLEKGHVVRAPGGKGVLLPGQDPPRIDLPQPCSAS